MKRKWQLFAAFLAVFATFALFAACSGGDSGGEGNTESETKTFEGIVLESKEFSYDGEVHFLQLTGTVPQGAKVEWEGNGESLPGVYNVSVTVSMEGYETLSLKATLTITALVFDDSITLEDIEVEVGEPYEVSLAHADKLPASAQVAVEYLSKDTGAVLTEKPETGGEYTVRVTVTAQGYESKTYTASLTIIRPGIESIALGGLTYGGNLPIGAVCELTVSQLPQGSEPGTFIFESSDERILTVSSEGIVTGVSAGTAKVTVQAQGYTDVTDEVTFTVFDDSDKQTENYDHVYKVGEDALGRPCITGHIDTYVITGNLELTVTDNAEELPEGGSGSALKIAQPQPGTSADGYTAVVIGFGGQQKNARYGISFDAKILTGNHIFAIQLFVGDTLIQAQDGAEGRNVLYFNGVEPTQGFTFRIANNIKEPYAVTIDNIHVFEAPSMAEDFENAVKIGGEVRGNIPVGWGEPNTSVELSLTESAEELPADGAGTALKAVKTGEAVYSYVVFRFDGGLAAGRYAIAFDAKLLSGTHIWAVYAYHDLAPGGVQLDAGQGKAGRNIFYFTLESAVNSIDIRIASNTAEYAAVFDNVRIFAADPLAEDFENASKIGETVQGNIITGWGAPGAGIVLSLTDDAAELPVGGEGTALKAVKTGNEGYSYIVLNFASGLAAGSYKLEFDAKLLSGMHIWAIQLFADDVQAISQDKTGAEGHNSFVYTFDAPVKAFYIRIASNTAEYEIVLDNVRFVAAEA